MHKTAAELIAEGWADVQSDEDWEREHLAQVAEAAATKAHMEAEWQEHVATTAKEQVRKDGLTVDELLNEIEAGWDAGGSASVPCERAPEAGAVGETGTNGTDWVADAIAAAPAPPGSLPYDAYRARWRIQETMSLMRILAHRNSYLSWQDGNAPGVVLGTATNSSIEKKQQHQEQEQEQELWRKRPLFPTSFPSSPTEGRTATVLAPEWSKLTRWKDLPAASKQDSHHQEILFGLRVASLASSGSLATVSTYTTATPDADVGMFSIKLEGDAAERFLQGEKGSSAAGLRRGLLRSLTTHAGDCKAVAVWTSSETGPKDVTLFVAIRMIDGRGAYNAQELDEGSRRVQRWEASGVRVNHYGLPHPVDMHRSYVLTDEQAEANSHGWPDAPDGVDPGLWKDQLEDYHEFYPGVGYATPDMIQARRNHVAKMWNQRVQAFGLPNWFNDRFAKLLQNYLTRSPDDSKQRARIVAAMKKGRATSKQKSALIRMDMIEPSMGDLRFYKGSPAQFAALALSSGKLVGSYCDPDHRAGAVKEMYEQLRASGASRTS